MLDILGILFKYSYYYNLIKPLKCLILNGIIHSYECKNLADHILKMCFKFEKTSIFLIVKLILITLDNFKL